MTRRRTTVTARMGDVRAHAVPATERGQGGRRMPDSSHINDPAHWHRRAEEMRKLADLASDEVSKQMMLAIAKDYDRLAERAQQRQSGLR